jgi:hypothetical protein
MESGRGVLMDDDKRYRPLKEKNEIKKYCKIS